MAFCAPIRLKTLQRYAFLISVKPKVLVCSRKRNVAGFSHGPRAVALPPAPTLLLLTGASQHRVIPPTLRGPPVAFLATALLANLSLLPAKASVYSTLIDIGPSAVCLLLLQPNSVRSQKVSAVELQDLLVAFVVGAVGTTLGAFIAGVICPLEPQAVWKMAAAFAATYVGGSVNYVGIVRALNLPTELAAAGLAADLAAMTVYFAGLFALASRVKVTSQDQLAPSENAVGKQGRFADTARTVTVPLVLTACLYVSTRMLSSRLALPVGSDLLLMSGLSVVLGRWGKMQPYMRNSARLGEIAITAFFASLGATTRLSAVVSSSPIILGVAVIVLGVHALVMILVGWVFLRLPAKVLLLASNANIGGASTAAAFAAACGWRGMVGSAVLAGTLGYMFGTPIGLLVFGIARRLYPDVS